MLGHIVGTDSQKGSETERKRAKTLNPKSRISIEKTRTSKRFRRPDTLLENRGQGNSCVGSSPTPSVYKYQQYGNICDQRMCPCGRSWHR